MAKKSHKQLLMEDIEAAGQITILRNTKASGKVLEKGQPYDVPGDVSVEDAFELVAVVRKATFAGQKEHKEASEKKLEDYTVPELKVMAKRAEVEGADSMKKADLIIALTPTEKKADLIIALTPTE